MQKMEVFIRFGMHGNAIGARPVALSTISSLHGLLYHKVSTKTLSKDAERWSKHATTMVVTYGSIIVYLRNFQEYEKQKIQIEIQILVKNFWQA